MINTAPTRYDRSALIHAYLDAVEELSKLHGKTGEEAEAEYASWSASAVTRSKTRLAYLHGLEELFGVVLRLPTGPGPITTVGSVSPALLMFLRSTAQSYHAIQTPFSGYLEATLLVRKMEEAGIWDAVSDNSDRMRRTTDDLRQQHLELLDTVLSAVLGDKADLVYELDDPAAAAIVRPEHGNPWDDW
ncbi:hypothetical protein [Nocardia sp. CDC160]|uniref:hypothetical protein n=1 Tax=Nocardia sp. CDC160 TaxID=3112166 RepID=UPI002DBF05ED|nr:hypothetical protein [Nocardia sp. CDC160]MEC3916293.1 hypothetical protein [Nocardia sp. CDC160]